MKFAAIDIGSNAIRLLFCNVFEMPEGPVFKKSSLIRVPIRLGEDVFTTGMIGRDKEDKLIKALKAFRHLMEVHEVLGYRACATSAMREASNKAAVVMRVHKETGINLEVVDGNMEASIIYSNGIAEAVDPDKNFLYIDVGGGSTEVTLISRNKIIGSHSFAIGTLRLLHQKVSRQDWNAMKDWISRSTAGYREITAIGSGGNINKIFKLSGKKQHKPLDFERLEEILEFLEDHSYEERMHVLGMNPDRADVIVPACKIYLTVMKAAKADGILVPQIGLSDGIVHQLYEEYKQRK